MLIGEAAGFQLSAMEAAPQAFGCMAAVLNDKRLSREELLQVTAHPALQYTRAMMHVGPVL